MVLLANIGQEEGRGKYLGKRMLNLISNMLNFWCSRNIMSLGFYGGTAALPLKYPLEIVMVLLDDPSLLWQHMSRNPDTPCPLWLMTHASAFFLPCLKFSGIIVDSTSKTPQRSKYAYEMKLLSRVRLSDPWTAASQARPSMGFSRQEYWSGVPLPSLNV